MPLSFVDDPRWQAFRSPRGPEVFHSVVSSHDIWKADPFDVEEIHADARNAFAQTVARINNAAPLHDSHADAEGKILLLRGESGSGKTHLMRAFRHYLHTRGLGWFAYLQMTTSIGHYPLYILRNMVESLGQPYDLSRGVDESGWLRLSNFLAEHPAVPAELRAALREGDTRECAAVVFDAADRLIDTPHFARGNADPNLVRVLLFLQRREPAYTRRVISYLRCDPLTSYDTDFIGGIPSRTAVEDPLEMLVQIGRLMNLFESQALVLCVDQLEDTWVEDGSSAQRFRDVLGAAQALTDRNPRGIVIISCLDAFYVKLRGLISGYGSLLDRVEKEAPVPVKLDAHRSPAEIEQMITKRLECLFQSQGADFKLEEGLFPFDPKEVAKLANFRPRGVLLRCREARERSVRTGERPHIGEGMVPPLPIVDNADTAVVQAAEQRWNDFRNGLTAPVPEKDDALATLLAWGIEEVNTELGTHDSGDRFAAQARHTLIEVQVPEMSDTPRPWLIGVCNGAAVGGRLSKQVTEATTAAQAAQPSRVPVTVRATPYPGTPASKIAKQMADMVKQGGRRVIIEDTDWRTLHALREFLPTQTDTAMTQAWRKAEQPLSRLAGLRALLLLDKLPIIEPRETVSPPTLVKDPDQGGEKAITDGDDAKTIPSNRERGESENDTGNAPTVDNEQSLGVQWPAQKETGPATLGQTREAAPKPVVLDPGELKRHTAFLGGTGSGKTTAALALIESLLLRGIPAILLDRKGDLASYARPECWTIPLPAGHSPDAEARRRLLRERVDVRLYTPGASSGGRPLGISLLPRGAGALPGPEREAAARAAASSLGTMLNYHTPSTAPLLAVLSKAIEKLAELEPDVEMTLPRLMDFIASEDDSLVNSIGHLEPKLFRRLLQNLAAFQVVKGHLLAPGGERVNAGQLLGIDDGGSGELPPAGKTRLSIISTKFFDDTPSALFWTAQFLLEMGRFAARHPSQALQGVILFDEADLYLPAVGKPVTKEPMENALRRWRSAGLGVMLASQSPGDFDYRCRENVRNWFVGSVKQKTAVDKMRPMLQEAKTDIAAKLPALKTGQFFLVREGHVESLASSRSLVDAQQMQDEEILRLAGTSQ